jgi:signal transduction histidine kinase
MTFPQPRSQTTTEISLFTCLLWAVQQDLINQQQCEIDRLQNVEQTALISQARKLMHRLASDIHDGPLQELKVIMDKVNVYLGSELRRQKMLLLQLITHLSNLA